jgi:tetratricopeptide (TPR) repeat protein
VDPQIEQGQQALRRLPGKPEGWILLGRLWIQKARESADPGYYLNADACAQEALQLDPSTPLAFGLQAQVALNAHRFTDALDLAQRALAGSPDDLVALGTRSDALLELGRFEEAAAAAQRMMDLKPNLASYTRASYFRWLQGDLVGAKEAAWKAAQSGRSSRDPEPHAWALVQAALLFWHQGDYEGALAGFERALAELADYPPALAGKGRALLSLQKPREAIPPLEASYKKNPLVETAWLLGDARHAAGDEAGAQEAYRWVAERGRLHDPRTLALWLATRRVDLDNALQMAKNEREKRGDIYTEDALGWALLRAGKAEEARPHLERAVRLGTPDASLLFHRGALEIAQNNRKEGEKWLRKAIQTNPRFDRIGAAEAEALLKGMPR